ncbi:fatty acid desaturase [Trichoderma cornu-damae]|uniref:Fatty acid desaturase n=1 Tax=Trichoderma cornu-damae TaxID=654480 RepID=A0A9P8TRM5_9HYPO|nr:fatty acid desaturase [Trichoderma cornu-damae]
MESALVYDRGLTRADHIVLKNLDNDIAQRRNAHQPEPSADPKVDGDWHHVSAESQAEPQDGEDSIDAAKDIALLKSMRNPADAHFEPTIVVSIDDLPNRLPKPVNKLVLQPFVGWARKTARHETDVVMIVHLILYLTTSVPSAILLFRNFNPFHGCVHAIMQVYYVGTYTLMMHQHIHQRGILSKKYAAFDRLFPYITDPLMGHTWNSYFYHHVKHHHIEGNGPEDLSSTIRYQRDDIFHFLHYVGRFFCFVWLDLPLYFVQKGRWGLAARAAGWEFGTYFFYYAMATFVNKQATIFVYIIPFLLLRLGLMAGNWGQHAFVDPDEPDSDYRSSITLVDVASNRFCFNDGYHTSHHLNPLRHWRDHPISFLEQRKTYGKEGALLFHNIDFLMITYRLMVKDYDHLAKCLVPLGAQADLTMEGRVEFLKRLTRKFSEEEIRKKFKKQA